MRLGNDKIGLFGVALVVVISIVSSFLKDSPPVRRGDDVSVRRPAIDSGVDRFAGAPEFSITVGEKKDSSGTAFSVGGGIWMTARHVVDGCDVVGVLERPGRGIRATGVTIHQSADVAVMAIGRAGPSVAMAADLPSRGDIAYHVGFPRGEPGEVRSRMMGMRIMNVGGRYSTREPVVAWAEIERNPDDPRPLSGLSGGPVFNAAGQVIGVHVAGSVRRGRSFTAHPSSIRAIMDRAEVTSQVDGDRPHFTPRSLTSVADALRASWTVAKALCDVK